MHQDDGTQVSFDAVLLLLFYFDYTPSTLKFSRDLYAIRIYGDFMKLGESLIEIPDDAFILDTYMNKRKKKT